MSVDNAGDGVEKANDNFGIVSDRESIAVAVAAIDVASAAPNVDRWRLSLKR